MVLVIGGYGLGWDWTGFPGNTVWDWLHLLLVPFTWYQVNGRRFRAGLRAELGMTDEATREGTPGGA